MYAGKMREFRGNKLKHGTSDFTAHPENNLRMCRSRGSAIPRAQITETVLQPEEAMTKLLIRVDGAKIMIEIRPVLRGCVCEPELRTVSPAGEEIFGYAEVRVLSFAAFCPRKIVATLDRHHPRDFFDVRDLPTNDGINEPFRRPFLVHLLSYRRPMDDGLTPKAGKLIEFNSNEVLASEDVRVAYFQATAPLLAHQTCPAVTSPKARNAFRSS